ncbi:MAG: succinate dehydrogenase, cytochrome b556 subunit [Gammaproteobacteria bacterium]|nr:succinate dehydrogenase, cytochrome b556 subunit [Gammaproteobacteria bacterium]HBW83597.1 succinate dehydrogenase, cytochrome b556 subunit [Gammaproteobacteria bacterium]
MKDTRPVNLDLTTVRFPLPAITSILHRISGVALFFGIGVMLYFLQLSLESKAGFERVLELMATAPVKIILWLILSGLLYHLIAGVKHLLMDWGMGESREGALRGAQVTLFLTAIAVILAWVMIW